MAVMGSNAPIVVPAAVEVVAAGRSARLAWVNEIGGLTYDVGEGLGRVFVKWVPPEWAPWLDAEFVRLEWASQFLTVPCPIDGGSDESGAWLVTTPLDGESAVAPRWLDEPARAVRVIGAGLRTLHELLPVERCPFSWSAAERVADARRRASAGAIDPSRWHEDHQSLRVEQALELTADIPPIDVEVVCHRPGWEPLLLDAYGTDADPDRTRFYRLLWDLDP